MDLLRDTLNHFDYVQIFEEIALIKTAKCIELEHCRRTLRAGDPLVVRLDRLGRSLSDLVKIIG